MRPAKSLESPDRCKEAFVCSFRSVGRLIGAKAVSALQNPPAKVTITNHTLPRDRQQRASRNAADDSSRASTTVCSRFALLCCCDTAPSPCSPTRPQRRVSRVQLVVNSANACTTNALIHDLGSRPIPSFVESRAFIVVVRSAADVWITIACSGYASFT